MSARRCDASYWRGKRVLLTGHTGFKGSWLALVLEQMGASVTGLALPPEGESLYEQARVAEVVDGHMVDLRDMDAVREVVGACDPEVVIHLAAQALVRDAHRHPLETFSVNVMGTANLLEALREAPSLEVVFTATTDKVYLNLEQGRAFVEADPLGGLEPYSASKAAAEHVVSAYRSSYLDGAGVRVLVGRAGNVIGGGDWAAERLLPDAIRALRAGEVMEVRRPGATRPWGGVLDVLSGYLLLIEQAGRGEGLDPSRRAWNFGPDATQPPVDVRSICEMMEGLWPGFEWRSVQDREQIKESTMLSLDPSRARDELGWEPCDPRRALEQTLSWYAEFLDGRDARELCIERIGRHPAFEV